MDKSLLFLIDFGERIPEGEFVEETFFLLLLDELT
jgi:hypothetical protein